MEPKYKLIEGILINPMHDKKAILIKNGALGLTLGKEGSYKIAFVGNSKEGEQWALSKKNLEFFDFSGHLIMPPFFDMHFHWVQDDVREMSKESLMDWLKNYTWPYEAKFAKESYAKSKAMSFFKDLVKKGTLGGGCYSSIHESALVCAKENIIGDFVLGNVIMTMNSPEDLTQPTNEAIQLVRKYSKKWKHEYAFTPRFAPTVDPETMKKCGEASSANGAFMQTHLSETKEEIEFVLDQFRQFKGFEKVKSYTEVYDKCGLLHKRSLFGHGIHLSNEELNLLASKKSKIIHCPTSNAPVEELGIGSGLFDFKRCEKFQVEWALGSDIGAGPYLSMFDVMRSFVQQNREVKQKEATYVKALYRATLKGAETLNLHKKKGNFEKGKEGSFLVIPYEKNVSTSSTEVILTDIIDSLSLQREQYGSLVAHVFYQGKQIL